MIRIPTDFSQAKSLLPLRPLGIQVSYTSRHCTIQRRVGRMASSTYFRTLQGWFSFGSRTTQGWLLETAQTFLFATLGQVNPLHRRFVFLPSYRKTKDLRFRGVMILNGVFLMNHLKNQRWSAYSEALQRVFWNKKLIFFFGSKPLGDQFFPAKRRIKFPGSCWKGKRFLLNHAHNFHDFIAKYMNLSKSPRKSLSC